MISECPSHCVTFFDDEKSWRSGASSMGAIILETEYVCGIGCWTAFTDDGAIGVFYPDSGGHLVDMRKGYH